MHGLIYIVRLCTVAAPSAFCSHRFIKEGEMKADYPIVIGGENFGCGSSREHAPVCMGAAGACHSSCITAADVLHHFIADAIRCISNYNLKRATAPAHMQSVIYSCQWFSLPVSCKQWLDHHEFVCCVHC